MISAGVTGAQVDAPTQPTEEMQAIADLSRTGRTWAIGVARVVSVARTDPRPVISAAERTARAPATCRAPAIAWVVAVAASAADATTHFRV